MSNNQENIINGFDFGSLPINIAYCGEIIEGKGGWDHFLYSVNIGTGKNMFTVHYKCGLGHMEKIRAFRPMPNPPYKKGTIAYQEWYDFNHKPKAPNNSDIMYSLLTDSEASNYSFSEWCDDFGYNPDSISALNIYQQCEKIGKQLNKVFSREQLQAMREALQDY